MERGNRDRTRFERDKRDRHPVNRQSKELCLDSCSFYWWAYWCLLPDHIEMLADFEVKKYWIRFKWSCL
jgi:hypothetical protein